MKKYRIIPAQTWAVLLAKDLGFPTDPGSWTTCGYVWISDEELPTAASLLREQGVTLQEEE